MQVTMAKILLILLFGVFLSETLSAQAIKHVFVLHSYSQEYPWTKSQHHSFCSHLESTVSIPMNFSVEYLDSKRVNFDYQHEMFMLRYLQKKYKDYHPDIIYVTDDDALTFFLHHHENLFPDVPVVFSGVNNVKLDGTLNPDKFTGVYETKDILPNIDLIHQLSPQTRDIWVVGDGSSTYQSIESDVKEKIANLTKYKIHFLSSDDISVITDNLPKNKRAFVILTTIGKWRDAGGNNLTIKESISTLLKNPNLVLISMEDAYMGGGALGGFVTSGKEQGRNAANLAGRFLKGEPFNRIQSIRVSPNIYMFDRKALIHARLILSEYTARNATILFKEKSFSERYQSVLFNILFILAALLLVVIVFSYFLIAEKNRRIEAHQHANDELSLMSNRLQTLFSMIEKNLFIGYWQWDVGDNVIIYSEGLGTIIGTDISEKVDFETMLLSVYPSDKIVVQSIIKEVMEKDCVKRFQHKIVSNDGNIVSVTHIIAPITREEGKVKTIVGMVQKHES